MSGNVQTHAASIKYMEYEVDTLILKQNWLKTATKRNIHKRLGLELKYIDSKQKYIKDKIVRKYIYI